MHRERGRAQAQAAPVNDVLVARMLAAAGDTLRHRRNRALLAVAYSTLCRRSELVVLRRADLQVDAEGFGTATIRRSKTDQGGLGDVPPIAADAMRHLSGWIQAAGVTDGTLFRAVLRGGRVGGALDRGDVARILGSLTQMYVKCPGPMRQLRAVCAASGCDRAENIGRRLSYRSGGGR